MTTLAANGNEDHLGALQTGLAVASYPASIAPNSFPGTPKEPSVLERTLGHVRELLEIYAEIGAPRARTKGATDPLAIRMENLRAKSAATPCRVVTVPSPRWIDSRTHGTGAEVADWVIPATALDGVLYAVRLLFRDFNAEVCSCRYCTNLFLEKREETGRPRRVFCTDDCQQQWRRETAAERTRKSREKKAAEKIKRRRRS